MCGGRHGVHDVTCTRTQHHDSILGSKTSSSVSSLMHRLPSQPLASNEHALSFFPVGLKIYNYSSN